ncbi:MAG: hypothetical protein MZU97_19820 [Bacillus subtilis]|nr:hypothetical protein [Bacillus subtilis]
MIKRSLQMLDQDFNGFDERRRRLRGDWGKIRNGAQTETPNDRHTILAMRFRFGRISTMA